MTEDEFQRRITDLCDLLGLLWHHETDSRKSKKGFPDLVIVGQCTIFAELKSDKGRVSPDQAKWADRLQHGRAIYFLWRPRDWPEVEKVLRRVA